MIEHYTLAKLADAFGVTYRGDGSISIQRVADLGSAGPDSISFLNNKQYLPLLETTRAAAVILSESYAGQCSRAMLICNNPHALYAKVAGLLHPDQDLQGVSGIHPDAHVAKSASVHPTAIVAPLAVVEDGVTIGAHSYIGPGCVLKRRVTIGESCKLAANVSIYSDCRLGNRVIVHAASVIGSDGFGFANEDGRWIKIPQLGRVIIGDDVEVGAGVAIDRGALNDTIIENGAKLDNQIHIAHNVTVGAHTAMAAQSGVAGSTVIGQHCAIGGAVGILGHLHIADGTRLNAFSKVTHSIEEAGNYASGTPLEPASQWRRNWVRFKQLDEMAQRIKMLEKKLDDLKSK